MQKLDALSRKAPVDIEESQILALDNAASGVAAVPVATIYAGNTEDILGDIVPNHKKTLILLGHLRSQRFDKSTTPTGDRIAEQLKRLFNLNVYKGFGEVDFQAAINQFRENERGVFIASVVRYEGWAVAADSTIFVEASLDLNSLLFRQLVWRNRTPVVPYLVNCDVHLTASTALFSKESIHA